MLLNEEIHTLVNQEGSKTMTAASTSKNNRQSKNSRKGSAGRKTRNTSEILERALSMASAADIELKALYRGVNDEFVRMDIIYPNY
jgi:hypothetical protein